MSSKVTYRQQYTRCGKERCRKCKEGAGHGPYWYAYWSENGRTISKYVGIRLPEHIKMERQIAGNAEDTTDVEMEAYRYQQSITHGVTPISLLAMDGKPQRVPLQLNTQVLRIYVLGQFRVDRVRNSEWTPVINRIWHRRRARALLGCLLSSPGRRLGREQAMEALWPDLDMDIAANRLNGAVHELRQILEPEIARPAASRMLRLERDVLELADRAHIWFDAETFEGLLNEANSLGIQGSHEILLQPSFDASGIERCERLLEEAAALYGGDYLLEELYSEWAAPRREVLRRGWIGLLLKLSEIREVRGALVSAMEPLNRLLATDPTDETAVQRLMLLLTQLDRRGEALSTYRRLAARLQRNYDSEPLPETRELYEKLRQGHISRVAQATFTIANAEEDTGASRLISNQLQKNVGSRLSTTIGNSTLPGMKETQKTVATDKTISRAMVPLVVNSQLGRYNQSPLIGRASEVETMRQIMLSIEAVAHDSSDGIEKPIGGLSQGAQGAARKAHVFLLMGEAGIGKTRLAEELSHEAHTRGWAVAWTRAYEQEGAIPYRPWIELLRTFLKDIPTEALISSLGPKPDEATLGTIHSAPTILERLSALLPELRDLLPQNSRTYSPLPPEQERLHLWEATYWLLSTLSKTTPLLLVLDDLHWTDDSSRELLAYLSRHVQDQRILLVGTCRDVELAPNHGLRTLIADLRREQAIVTLTVQPLTRSQIGSLVSRLPQNIVQSIQMHAAGNPFFAEELARASEALLPMSSSSENSNIAVEPLVPGFNNEGDQEKTLSNTLLPEGIAAVLERRLGRLSNECQILLGKAAVLGGSFEFSQLLFMASELHEDSILDLLEEALHAGLLTEEGSGAHITYHFWHPLIVSHLYERLSAARCSQLHRRAASALLHAHQGHEEEVAAAITHHLSKGGSDRMQIAYYAELAGNQAYRLAAYAEAQQYYRQAVQTITGGRLPIKDKVNETLIRKFIHIAPDIADALHVAHLLEHVSECCLVQGNYEEARLFYEYILELRNQRRTFTSEAERQQEAQIQGVIWCDIGRTLSLNGDNEQAIECYERGKQVMRNAGVTSGAAWACIHLQHGAVLCLQGNYDEARRYVLEALEMLEEVVQHREGSESESFQSIPGPVASRLQEIPLRRTQPEINSETKQHYLPTHTERSVIGDPLEVGRAHELLGLIAASVGQYTEALKHLHRALAIFEQHDLVIAMVKVCGNLGAVHAMKSENTLAHTYMRRSLELAERLGNLPNMAFVSGNLGEMALRSGDLLQAEEWFRRSLAIAERTNVPESVSWCNVGLAGTLQDQGHLENALECVLQALTIGRAMKSIRCIGSALVALGDLRLSQAIVACRSQGMDIEHASTQRSNLCHRYLLRAKSTLERAIALEGLETESVIEGQLLLASVHFLLGKLETALQQTMETMEVAREHEITRMHARSQRLLGHILAEQGDYGQSDYYFEEALMVFRACEMRLDCARALHGYGVSLLKRCTPGEDSYQRGLAYLREARTIFAECHAAIDLELVEDRLARADSQIVGA